MARFYCACALGTIFAVAAIAYAKPVDDNENTDTAVDIRMPNVQPKMHDTYLCVPMEAGRQASYITGFIPHANSSTAHHMLIYGCSVPFAEDRVWNCGEMVSPQSTVEQGPVCKEGATILYAWAGDAPELHLPKDVAFKVGGDTNVNWVVLQVHYKDVHLFLPPLNQKDKSGITMLVSDKPKPKRAGVYLLATEGEIAPKATTYMETACSFNEPITIHPFAFRTHAHSHGEVLAGYRVRDGVWTELGRKSPKLPEMFYNVTHPGIEIKAGDIIAARCTMVNEENRTVGIGSTVQDEMCNYYLMYWVDGDDVMSDNYCVSPGPPSWYWHDVPSLHVENVPKEASIVPGTTTVIEATKVVTNGGNSDDEAENINALKEEFLHLLADIGSQLENGNEAGQRDLEDDYYPAGNEALESYYNENRRLPE